MSNPNMPGMPIMAGLSPNATKSPNQEQALFQETLMRDMARQNMLQSDETRLHEKAMVEQQKQNARRSSGALGGNVSFGGGDSQLANQVGFAQNPMFGEQDTLEEMRRRGRLKAMQERMI
jgi:hypothetical protein